MWICGESCYIRSFQRCPLIADDNLCKHSPQIARGGCDGEEAWGKHTVDRGISLNGKVLRGRKMRRGGDIRRKSHEAAPVPRHTSAPV